MNTYFVYILTNQNKTALYIGMTNDLERRLYEHKNKLTPWFASQYNCTTPVLIETCTDVNDAIRREKQLKGWTHKKKVDLIEIQNPYWKDLSQE